MSDSPEDLLEPRAPTLLDRKRFTPPSRKELSSAYWRMLALVWPHRRRLICGLVLGFGVALTYATSLAGMLPVLNVVVEKKSLGVYLAEWAAKAQAKGAFYAEWVASAARWFPAPVEGAASADSPMRTLLILLGVLFAINVVGNVFRVLSQYLVLHACNRAVMDLRRKMYRKALYIPMTALSGELSNVVSQFLSDVREVFLGLTTLFGKVAREPLKAICVLIVAIMIDARLTLTALAIAPPAIGLLWYFGRQIRKATVKLLEGYGFLLAGLEETLQGVAVVKSYTRENYERKRMWRLERQMLKQQLKLAWVEAISSPLIEVAGILAASAGIVWLASRVFSGEIEPSRFLLMVGLLAAMLDPIRKIANVYNMVQRSSSAAHRIFGFLDQPEEKRGGKRLSLNGPPAVEFSEVVFRYAADTPLALDRVNLRVNAGECVAVVGPNGSGKSTLLRLLPRLLEQQGGAIRLDGRDTRELSLRDLRQAIAIVDQRAVIFARSVAENVGYGRENAQPADVQHAVAHAHAADFIDRLNEKYETRVGEFGATLSGGQRQRLSIARAFLKPARVLIFDEATSEIDAESEAKIHDALDELRIGKTTFLIAHRHTVMDMADRIVVMDAGRIVDVGTRAELLARCPLFLGLYRGAAQ
ncbi:MAG: ABC transporter ATP-binding protein [Phycisphaerae bacterium]|nr:ABC transporter ATP-binding protein [Phycisphaerae bacterium]